MRTILCLATLAFVGCSNAPPSAPAVGSTERSLACVVCPGLAQPIWKDDLRVIEPEIDPAEVARRLGRPELEPVLEQLVMTAQARVASAPDDDQARAIVDALLVDLNRVARPL